MNANADVVMYRHREPKIGQKHINHPTDLQLCREGEEERLNVRMRQCRATAPRGALERQRLPLAHHTVRELAHAAGAEEMAAATRLAVAARRRLVGGRVWAHRAHQVVVGARLKADEAQLARRLTRRHGAAWR